jgi:hypothetical protein
MHQGVNFSGDALGLRLFGSGSASGLPTTRPESLARCTPRKSGSPHVRLARYSAKWNPSCSESSKREFWHPARHGGFDESTDLSRILLFVFLGDSAENNLRIENEPAKPV